VKNSPAGQERTRAEGRVLTDTDTAVANPEVTILAEPDRIMRAVSADIAPKVPGGGIILTLEPFGHIQVALASGPRGDNPYSEACLIAIDYGRETLIKADSKNLRRQ
jgi:hypothetical protein